MKRNNALRVSVIAAVLIGIFSPLAVFQLFGGKKFNVQQSGTVTNGSPSDNKLSAGLRFMVHEYEAIGRTDSHMKAEKLLRLYDGSMGFRLAPGLISQIPQAQVFVKIQSPSAIADLERLGVRVITLVDDIVIAWMPVTATQSVAELSDVLSVTISSQSKIVLNLSRVEAKVDAVHTGTGLDRSYRGNGVLVGIVDSGIGTLSSFSSHGPTRDGRSKPDFVAPGEVIIAALASNLILSPSVVLQGGGLQKQQGTSMACPHVAGIVALMLEKNRYFTYENVVSILSTTARASGSANLFGAGKVQALNAMQATPAGVDCAALAKITGYDCEGNRILSCELMDAYPNPFNPSTTITYRIAKPELVSLTVYDMLGRLVKTLTHEEVSEGEHVVLWNGTNDEGVSVASGMYLARLSTPGFALSNRLLLLK